MSTFVLKTIPITLDSASLERAARIVRDFEKKLKPAAEKLVEYFAKEGQNVARAELLMFDPPAYYTGDLAESITYHTHKDGSAVVTAGEGLGSGDYPACSYALFVEFGTGMGKGPSLRGTEGWVYYNDRDGNWYWTAGMEPRPFMHNTLEDLEEKALIDGGRVIAEYLRE